MLVDDRSRTLVSPGAPAALIAELEIAGISAARIGPPEVAAVTLHLGPGDWRGASLEGLLAFQRASPNISATLLREARSGEPPVIAVAHPAAEAAGSGAPTPAGRVLRHRPGWRPETILLDRDGTLVFDRVHLGDPDGVELLPGVLTGLRLLQQAGIRRVIVSNQSGIGRGLLSHGQVAAVHDRLKALLYDDGLTLDGIFYCPHSPEESCPCRKPQMGLAREASVQLGVDLARSVVVGDTDADVGLAEGLGVPSILVLTGSGPATLEAGQVKPHFAVTGLEEMARIILHPGGLGLPLE